MSELKLKKCPFCGGPAEIVDNSRYDPGTYFVGCLYCGARTDYDHGEENAAELWNGRVEPNDHYRGAPRGGGKDARDNPREPRRLAVCRGYDDTAMERAAQDMIERAYTVGRMESSEAVARETARIIAEGIAKELGTTPGEEQTCDSR